VLVGIGDCSENKGSGRPNLCCHLLGCLTTGMSDC
jgi:hypothetical protein